MHGPSQRRQNPRIGTRYRANSRMSILRSEEKGVESMALVLFLSLGAGDHPKLSPDFDLLCTHSPSSPSSSSFPFASLVSILSCGWLFASQMRPMHGSRSASSISISPTMLPKNNHLRYSHSSQFRIYLPCNGTGYFPELILSSIHARSTA